MGVVLILLYCIPFIVILILPFVTNPMTPQWDNLAYQSSLNRSDAIKSFISRGKVNNRQSSMDETRLSTDTDSTEDTSTSTKASLGARGKTILDWTSLEQAINAIRTTIRLYGTQGVIAAFNGGKDATVVLDLYTAILADHYRQNPHLPRLKPRAVYFLDRASEFKDVQEFVEERRTNLDLDLTICSGSFMDCIVSYLETLRIPQVGDGDWVKHPAFLLGVRRGDPRSESLSFFEPSSEWIKASFMRVHPILDWNYGMVWDYFDLFKGVYCPLYDQGYTSLGRIGETLPNVHLKALGTLRARDLVDWDRERGGRDSGTAEHDTPKS